MRARENDYENVFQKYLELPIAWELIKSWECNTKIKNESKE